MKKELLTILPTSLLLAGCERLPDLADNLHYQCKIRPEGVATISVPTIPDKHIRIANDIYTLTTNGSLRGETPVLGIIGFIQGEEFTDRVIEGRNMLDGGRRYVVKVQPLEEERFIVLASTNCPQPFDPLGEGSQIPK